MDEKLFLKNYVEEFVWEFLDTVLSNYPDICDCESCCYDMVAIALNTLPPRYVVREKREVYSKSNILQAQYRADIYAALVKALLLVKENPRHE